MTALDPDNKGAKLWVVQAGDTLTAAGVWGGASDGQLFYRGIPFQNNNTGAMVALQPATGERVWYTTLTPEQNCAEVKTPPGCGPSNRSASSAITGAVFTGSRDGVLRAYSTKDGKIIWEFNTNRQFETVNGVPGFGGGIGAGGPSIVDGMLYVGSGYGILGGGYGNVVLAFGVD
jgi:polyvinyl alcohol dehydrogenase (cytochrome)